MAHLHAVERALDAVLLPLQLCSQAHHDTAAARSCHCIRLLTTCTTDRGVSLLLLRWLYSVAPEGGDVRGCSARPKTDLAGQCPVAGCTARSPCQGAACAEVAEACSSTSSRSRLCSCTEGMRCGRPGRLVNFLPHPGDPCSAAGWLVCSAARAAYAQARAGTYLACAQPWLSPPLLRPARLAAWAPSRWAVTAVAAPWPQPRGAESLARQPGAVRGPGRLRWPMLPGWLLCPCLLQLLPYHPLQHLLALASGWPGSLNMQAHSAVCL